MHHNVRDFELDCEGLTRWINMNYFESTGSLYMNALQLIKILTTHFPPVGTC